MDLLGFFKLLGKAFEKAGRFIVRFISDEQLDFAADVVKGAADKFITGKEKRDWAIAQIQARFPLLPESMVRWLVETSVMRLKAEAEEAIDRNLEVGKRLNDPPAIPPAIEPAQ